MPAAIVTPLVAAASALDEELSAYDEVAREAAAVVLSSEKSLGRAVSLVQELPARNQRIQEKLGALVKEIEAARARQVASSQALLREAERVRVRSEQHAALVERFAALGESARRATELAAELSTKREAGATEQELLEGLQRIQIEMASVAAEAVALASLAREQDWPDLARRADGLRQQVLAAKNKVALAHSALAARAPS